MPSSVLAIAFAHDFWHFVSEDIQAGSSGQHGFDAIEGWYEK